MTTSKKTLGRVPVLVVSAMIAEAVCPRVVEMDESWEGRNVDRKGQDDLRQAPN
jgi:hypothetical protein